MFQTTEDVILLFLIQEECTCTCKTTGTGAQSQKLARSVHCCLFLLLRPCRSCQLDASFAVHAPYLLLKAPRASSGFIQLDVGPDGSHDVDAVSNSADSYADASSKPQLYRLIVGKVPSLQANQSRGYPANKFI